MKHLARSAKASQRGVVLFITLIVLVALALGALAMYRGSMGTALVATNVAYKQGTLSLSDTGVQLAVVQISGLAAGGAVNNDNPATGYYSSTPPTEADWTDGANWSCSESFCGSGASICGTDATCVTNSAGYLVKYKIQRMCTLPGVAYNGTDAKGNANECALSQTTGSSVAGNTQTIGNTPLFSSIPTIYFRITARVEGPRNSLTITQAVVALPTS